MTNRAFGFLAVYLVQDLKTLRLGLYGVYPDDELEVIPPTRSLWNSDENIRKQDTLVIADTDRYAGQLLHHTGHLLCQYLPLQTRGRRATALTAYCVGEGICGMAAYFGSGSPRHTVGRLHGVPVHIHYLPWECIALVAMRTYADN